MIELRGSQSPEIASNSADFSKIKVKYSNRIGQSSQMRFERYTARRRVVASTPRKVCLNMISLFKPFSEILSTHNCYKSSVKFIPHGCHDHGIKNWFCQLASKHDTSAGFFTNSVILNFVSVHQFYLFFVEVMKFICSLNRV